MKSKRSRYRKWLKKIYRDARAVDSKQWGQVKPRLLLNQHTYSYNYKGYKMDIELFKKLAASRLEQLTKQAEELSADGWKLTGYELESKVHMKDKDGNTTCNLYSNTEMEE